MTSEEHEHRLRYDTETVLTLQLNNWADNAWRPVAEALAEYGYAVMTGWLYTGKIFAEVAKVGKPVERCDQGWLDDDTISGLANETVANAVKKFRVLLTRRAWKAEKGASLATYFVGQCKFQFSDVYKSWLKQERRHRQLAAVTVDLTQLGEGRDPAVATVQRGTAHDLLSRMNPKVAEIFRLKYLDGYTYQEIAEMLDDVPNAKAAENLVTRERKRWTAGKSAS